MTCIPSFGNETIDAQEPLRRPAAQVVNAAMSVETSKPYNGGANSLNSYREVKRRSRAVQVPPSAKFPVCLSDIVMREQDETWQGSRCFSEPKMNKIYNEKRAREIDGPIG